MAAELLFPLFRSRDLLASDGLSFKLTRVGDTSRDPLVFDILQASSMQPYRVPELQPPLCSVFRPLGF